MKAVDVAQRFANNAAPCRLIDQTLATATI
jgi:hypothetical protein